MRIRGVVFDLWDTLVEWPVEQAERLERALHEHVGGPFEEFERRRRASYRASQTGPLAEVFRSFGLRDDLVERHVAAWHEFGRQALRLRDGAADALRELRRRGARLGLISVCSEEVPLAWPHTDLAPYFEAATFSSECGLMKPEPEIYLRTAAELGVEPEECVFVGDGANDELAGAERVGMRAVLFCPNGEPYWESVRDWRGPRVSSIGQVLELVPEPD